MKCPDDINEYLKGVDAFDRIILSFSNKSIIISFILIAYIIGGGIFPYYKYVCKPHKNLY